MTVERRKRLALALISLGVALRTWQYAGRGSLWLDEAALARNVLARSWAELLQPLDYTQVAPRGFLLATKAAASLLGPTEHALRLYSFLLSVLALPLLYRLARSILPERAALLALGLFAVLGRPVFYASEAKQYSGDLFFAILLLLLAMPLVRGDAGSRQIVAFGVAGAVAVWFSQPTVFVIAGIALVLAVAVTRGRMRPDRAIFAALAICALSAGAAVYATLHTFPPADAAYMRSFWERGFLPWPPAARLSFVRDAIAWPFTGLYGLFYDLLGMPVATIGAALALLGAVALWRRERAALLLLLAPIAVTIGAGALRIFPFATTLDGFNKLAAGNARLLLFLLPALVLLVVAGLDALLDAPRIATRRAGRALAVLTLGTPLYYDLAEIPYTPHDLRAVIAAASRYVHPGDRLYVYYGARQSFELYRARFPFPDSATVRGECHRPAWREYLRDLDALRGTGRVWVLMVRPALVNGVAEGQMIDDYLGQVAPRLARWGQKDANLSLYDMRIVNPMRGDRAAWHPERRALPGDTVALGFSCAGIFSAPHGGVTDRRNPQLR